MGVNIHPSAIVEKGAELGEDVTVECFCFVGKKAKISEGTIIRHHASIEGDVFIGKNNEIFPYALIGGLTHDLKYRGGVPKLRVGENNVFREFVTAHVATNDGEFTTIGSCNVFLAYSHIAHDCRVGDHVVMSSHAALGGHVEVHDHANIGWGSGIHQFCQVGRYAMLSACSKLVQDVPPYMLADGAPAEVRSINKIAMERAGFSSDQIEMIKGIFKTLYKSDLNKSQAIEKIRESAHNQDGKIQVEILKFINSSNRGLA